MGTTNFPGGVSSYGNPVLPDTYYKKVLWVGNTSGLPSSTGKDADHPLAAIFGATGAIAKAHPTLGTLIRVHRGHTESVSAADMASLTGTSKNIVILGEGDVEVKPGYDAMRPTLTWTVAGATWLFDTVGIKLVNFNLLMAGPLGSTTALTVAAPVTVSASGCALRCNWINAGIDADQIVTIGVTTTAGADGFQFFGNTVRTTAADAVGTTFLRIVGGDTVRVQQNDIVYPTSSAAIGAVQALTTAPTNIRIEDNYIENNASGATAALTLVANATGVARRNDLKVAGTGTAYVTTPGSVAFYETRGVNAISDGTAEKNTADFGTASS
jgi:hypothetical protein